MVGDQSNGGMRIFKLVIVWGRQQSHIIHDIVKREIDQRVNRCITFFSAIVIHLTYLIG